MNLSSGSLRRRWLRLAACAALLPIAPAAHAASAEVSLGSARLQVTALADDLLRVRIAPDGQWPEDASWVVPAGLRARSVSVQEESTADSVGFRTAVLRVRIERSTLRLTVSDLAGQVVLADAPDRPFESHGTQFELRKALAIGEHIFGMGDKTGLLDRRGGSFTDWNTDAYHFEQSTDPLYKSIPFFVSVGGAGGSYGVYLDNTWRSNFDFGHRDPSVLSFGAVAGPIDYYILYGPALRQVVQRFSDLSGKAPLPPLWAFGFQQSRYSYMSAAEVRGIASRLRSEHLPADVIWMDIDYQDRNRPFTTNRKTFPDLPALVRDVGRQGIHLVAITDLHVADAPNQGYAPFDTGTAGDHFVHRADGSVYVGEVWPGPAVFPEFTRAQSRQWWGGLYQDFMAAGIAGFWNDMNEPAIFKTPTKTMPPDVVHRIDEPGFAPRTATHAEIHNIFGMENARATYEGMLRLKPDERPYVMTRASFAGGQRYSATWTGDNSATWNHLKLSIAMLLNLNLSGFSYSGVDVGGYRGAPSAALMTRWMEIAAFLPVFRNHSEKGAIRKEPWSNGPAQTAIRRRFIEARYRLLPYFYALADENTRTGAPIMRPVFYEFPAMIDASCDQSSTFLAGDRLLIAPPPDFESPVSYDICLPEGGWYDYWTGAAVAQQVRAGADAAAPVAYQIVKSLPVLDRLPVYVRAGSILPRQPLVQSTSETPRGALELAVYPGADCHGTLYADDGHSLAYGRGGFLRQSVRCEMTAQGLTVSFDARAGSYRPWWKTVDVVVHGWRGGASASFAGKPASVRVVPQAQEVHVLLDDPTSPLQLELRHRPPAVSGSRP
ncbi:MAG TPA: TIM-barrel domain-containing protein [Steroidobacteraceae bacterium]|nr:TIM-barrel domain-containing protein [Steroidobacteraceae bacterium]